MGSPPPESPGYTPNPQHELGMGHPGRRRSGLRSRGTQLLAIRFGWVVLVIWYEVSCSRCFLEPMLIPGWRGKLFRWTRSLGTHVQFFSSLSSCKFPDSQLRSTASRFSRQAPPAPPPTHLVLLADPHVPHSRLSYSPDSRPWVSALRQAMDELFMRKSWNVVMRLGRVDGVVVLGDMLDWGRGVISSKEWVATPRAV